MSKIEVFLGSLLFRDALSTVLTAAGFSVSHEPDHDDHDATVIIDFDDRLDPELLQVHQQRGVKIVALINEADVAEVDHHQVEALSGILTYELSADAFCAALRLICRGERVFPRNLSLERKPPSSRAEVDRLTPREREVLAHLTAGHSNKAIARHLGVAEETVKVYLKSLLRTIKVKNRTQAAIWAVSIAWSRSAGARSDTSRFNARSLAD